MNREELSEYKAKMGYNLGQLELDYYHHKILEILYKKYNTLYFKGGTCMQKCYGLKRFSEDLDFNYIDIDIEKLIEYIIKELDVETTLINRYETKFGISFVLKIKGILYTGAENSYCRVSLDFRKDDTYLDTKKLIIRPIYNDLDNYFLLALNEEEIFAEKVRATITRYKARDIFDLVELLYKNVKINYELINLKLKTYDLKYSKDLLLEKVKEKKEIYQKEIGKLTDVYSSFEESFELINEKFEL